MGLIDKLTFSVWDEVQAVVGLIEKWEPKKCKTEKDYEKSLIAHLRAQLPGITVTPQYAKGRIRADLVIGEKVIVEIKKDLQTTGNYQRLVGQLSDYTDWEGRIVVLLVGTGDPDIKSSLDKAVYKLNGGFFGDGRITVLEKR